MVLFALLMLLGAVAQRRAVTHLPPGVAVAPAGEGFQGLIPDAKPHRPAQTVLVAASKLKAGTRILDDQLAQAEASQVVDLFPGLRTAASRTSDVAPLLDGCYTQAREALGRYASTDIPAGAPLTADNTSLTNVRQNPLDLERNDRFTIPLAPEPTVFPLLKAGDRVDLYFVCPDLASRRAVADVRVIAINQDIVADEDPQLSAEMRLEQHSTRAWAARRKRDRMLAARGKVPDTPDVDDYAYDRAKAARDRAAREKAGGDSATAGGSTETKAGAEPSQTPATGGRLPFDGRSLTVQVSEPEAQMLAAAARTPKLYIGVTLRART